MEETGLTAVKLLFYFNKVDVKDPVELFAKSRGMSPGTTVIRSYNQISVSVLAWLLLTIYFSFSVTSDQLLLVSLLFIVD